MSTSAIRALQSAVMPTFALLLSAAVVAASANGADAPRAAARAYFSAILRGDVDAALRLVVEASDADRLTVRASAASERGLARLEELATSQFGARGDLGIAARHRKLLSAIDGAPVELNGDRAVLRPSGERPVRLRRVAGEWKVESPAERLTGEEAKQLDEALRRTEETTRDLGERIRSGALDTADALRDALRKTLGDEEEKGVPL